VANKNGPKVLSIEVLSFRFNIWLGLVFFGEEIVKFEKPKF